MLRTNGNFFELKKIVMATALMGMACSSSTPEPKFSLGYDEANLEILVSFDRALKDGESLHARVRQGAPGELSCLSESTAIPRVDPYPVELAAKPTWHGPVATEEMFSNVYTTAWLEGHPSEEMIAEAKKGNYLIDLCLMGPEGVVRQASVDIMRAKDKAGTDGKFDGYDEEEIVSTSAYAERCLADLGEIPFFEKIADGDYKTYNCLDSTPIPTTVTKEDGTVEFPETEVSACDNPQFIYSSCEPNAVDGRTNGPRVASRRNDRGTHWVLLCRKAKSEEGAYDDIAMIGTNPFTGQTCFFQNALYSRTDGLHVPHPGDTTESELSPQTSVSLWNGIHGGIGSGIECAKCHSSDALIHTPWIDGAKTESGDPVIPKMGVHDDFVLGFNDAPYSLINAAGQGWRMPQHLVSEEAAACTRCHRIAGDDRWMNSWMNRLVGKDTPWTNITSKEYQKFEHTFWMPPDLDGLDENTWEESEQGKAMAFILACKNDNSNCKYEPLPTEPISDAGELPEIEIEGVELARESLKILGANIQSPDCENDDCNTRRCAECHSVSVNGLERWKGLTNAAWNTCNLSKDYESMSPEEAVKAIDCLRVEPDDPFSVFEAEKLGILTTGVQYSNFRKLFQKAYGLNWLVPYVTFKARVGMPKGSHPKLSQKEYATLVKWFKSDLSNIGDVLSEPPPPSACVEEFNTSLINSHLSEMAYDGWGAVNEENGIRMYGCSPGADPRTCLGGKNDRTSEWGNGVGSLRELTKLNFRSSFWTRSSADGRFVGNGGGPEGATITDLSLNKDIGVDASYDPGFFPDNSGFIFQGATGGAGICAQSILESDDLIDFKEPQCISARGINLYQHVARGTNGGDYFIINSQFTSDSGRRSVNPTASFSVRSTMKFTPMSFNGSTYEPMSPTIVDSPYEGDSVLSPSSKLVVSRLAGPGGVSLGYVIRKISATRFGDKYTITTNQKLATVCEPGAKASFSFDERFMVTHAYEQNKANIILVDLTTGARHRITNMPENKYAQFPHFRSDGWLYFLVTSQERDEEYIVASDAALVLQGQ